MGASAQFVEVPRVGDKRLALSGVALTQADAGDKPMAATFARQDRGQGHPLRRPAPRQRLLGKRHGAARRQAGPRKRACAARRRAPDTPGVAPIPFRGTLTLGDDFTPGLYTLQIDIEPQIEGKKRRPVRQWVDFEVR